jgi:hypothetical protein
MRTRLRLTAIVGLAAATALVAGCQNTTTAGTPAATGKATAATTGSTSTAGGGSDPGAGPASTATIRVANFYAPGAGIDIYDVSLQGQAAKPILTNVAYGTVSAYAQPHQQANSIDKAVLLTALPTGEDPVAQKGDATQIGGLIDDGSHAQATIVVTASGDAPTASGTSLLGNMSDSMRMEKGDDGQGGKGPAAPAVTDGSSELLVDTTSIPTNLSPSLYLMVDSSCAPPLNGDPNMGKLPFVFAAATSAIQSQFAIFSTPAAAHQVSVVSWTTSTEPTCAQLTTPQGTTTVTTTANQQVLIFVYGSTLDALHLAVAPIQP